MRSNPSPRASDCKQTWEAVRRRWIAARESPRTTKLYDRTTGQVSSLDEIERIVGGGGTMVRKVRFAPGL